MRHDNRDFRYTMTPGFVHSPSGINHDHPQAEDLIYYAIGLDDGGEARDIVNNLLTDIFVDVAQGSTIYGRSFDFTPSANTEYDCFGINELIDWSQPWSMIFDIVTGDLAQGADVHERIGGCDEHAGVTAPESASVGIFETGGSHYYKIFSWQKTPGFGSQVQPNTQYNCGLYWDGTQLGCYLDGVFDYSVTPTSAIDWNAMTGLELGHSHTTGGVINEPYAGSILSCRVYTRLLSADEFKDAADIHQQRDLIISARQTPSFSELVEIIKSIADNFNVSDSASQVASLQASEAINLTDADTLQVGHTVSDTFLTEELDAQLAQVSISDNAELLDANITSALVSASEAVSVADNVSVAAAVITIGDTFNYVDVAQQIGTTIKTITDAFNFVDEIGPVSAQLLMSDTPKLGDSVILQASASLTDTLGFDDTLDVVKTIIKTIADTLRVNDDLSMAVSVQIADPLTLDDQLSIEALVSSIDTITGYDTVVGFDSTGKIVTFTMTMKAPQMRFTMKSSSMRFTMVKQ